MKIIFKSIKNHEDITYESILKLAETISDSFDFAPLEKTEIDLIVSVISLELNCLDGEITQRKYNSETKRLKKLFKSTP